MVLILPRTLKSWETQLYLNLSEYSSVVPSFVWYLNYSHKNLIFSESSQLRELRKNYSVVEGSSGQTQSLNNLQIAFFNGQFDSITGDEGKDLAQRIMRGDQSIFEDFSLDGDKWKEYKFRVKVTPLVETIEDANKSGSNSDEPDSIPQSIKMHLKLTLLHVIVLSRDLEILRSFIREIFKDRCKTSAFWMEEPVVHENRAAFEDHNGLKIKVAEEEVWIHNANCYHLAARFNAKALYALFDLLGKDNQKDIKEIFKEASPSPLHVAAFNNDSISAW